MTSRTHSADDDGGYGTPLTPGNSGNSTMTSSMTPSQIEEAHTMGIEQYVAEYEFRGETDYKPNEREQEILIDALHGWVASSPAPAPEGGEARAREIIASQHEHQDRLRSRLQDPEWRPTREHYIDAVSTMGAFALCIEPFALAPPPATETPGGGEPWGLPENAPYDTPLWVWRLDDGLPWGYGVIALAERNRDEHPEGWFLCDDGDEISTPRLWCRSNRPSPPLSMETALSTPAQVQPTEVCPDCKGAGRFDCEDEQRSGPCPRCDVRPSQVQPDAVSGERLDLSTAIQVAQRGFEDWANKPHNSRWLKKVTGTPIPNDVTVCIAEAFYRALGPNAHQVIADANRAAMMLRAGVTDDTRKPGLGPPEDMAVARILLDEQPTTTRTEADRLAVKIVDALKPLLAAAPSPPVSDEVERLRAALDVISKASKRSETMFGGKMSEVARVFEHITRVSEQALKHTGGADAG